MTIKMWGWLTITLLLVVVVLLLLHWQNIITLTDVFASRKNLSKLVIAALDDPRISGLLTLTVTVFFIWSNSLTTILLVVVSAVFSLHRFKIFKVTHFFPSAIDRPEISGAAALTIAVFLTLSNTLATTILAAVNVLLWFHWLEIINLKDVMASERYLSEVILTLLDEVKMSEAFAPTITAFFMSISVEITLFLIVVLIFCLLRFIIILLRHRSTCIESMPLAKRLALVVKEKSTLLTSPRRNLSKLAIAVLDDPRISGVLTLTVTVFFIWSNSLTTILLVVVSAVLSLHRFFPSAIDRPEISGATVLTIAVFLTLSNTLATTILAAVNVLLWFHWLEIINLKDVLASERYLSEVILTLLDEVKMSGLIAPTITAFFMSNSVVITLFLIVFLIFRLLRFRPQSTCIESKLGAKRLAVVVKEKSTLLTSPRRHIPVYKLPLEEKQISIKGCKSFTFGEKSFNCNRNIMVLGATGAGKSTVINGMINYVLGVRWEDSFRFKLVDEGQVHSQTSEITVYKLYHQEGFLVNYSLTIIDSPSFGDIGGADRDKELTEQLRNLFTNQEGIGDIDAVCVVVEAALTELTSSQRSMFDSALSIFGKGVAENIRILVTFADEQQPPVLEAIKVSSVPCPTGADGLPAHFQFNNSVLFAYNKSSWVRRMIWCYEEKSFEFWNMGTKSMAAFFASLTNIRTIRLRMTTELQEERKQLESNVEELQKQVKLSLSKLEDIRETNHKLKEHEAEIRRNENFEFHVTKRKNRQIDISNTGKYITNCMQCYVTCHYPCGIPNDDGKKGCSAMGSKGYCTVCPGKCFWNVHSNQSFRWEYDQINKTETVKQLKEKYETVCGQKVSLEDLMAKLMSEYRSMQDDVVKLITESAKCLNRMKEIILNPNPLTTPEYMDLLIKGEEKEAREGWRDRVQSLLKLKEKAEILAKVEEEVLAHQ